MFAFVCLFVCVYTLQYEKGNVVRTILRTLYDKLNPPKEDVKLANIKETPLHDMVLAKRLNRAKSA